MTVTNNSIILTSPAACVSQDLCTGFKAQSKIPLTLLKGTLLLCKKGTQICVLVTADFGAGIDLRNGWTPSLVFNNIDPAGLVVPPCGGSVTITPIWALTLSTGPVTITGPDFTLTSGNCTVVEMHGVTTTQDIIGPCVGVGGTLGIQGTLDTVGFGGLLQTFNDQLVTAGLIDPSTGIFYQYAGDHTGSAGAIDAGKFSVAFGISSRADVVALVPPAGSKAMRLAAIYAGDDTHTPAMATKDVTVQGEANTHLCFAATSILKQTFNPPPPQGQEIHEMVQAFTTSIIPSQVQAQAQTILKTTHDAIVKAGATPIDVEVLLGPGIPLLSIEGLGAITVPSLVVVSHAFGSPVPAAVVALVIIAALIALGILVYFILKQVTEILMLPGGAGTLISAAVAIVAVAAVAGLILYTRRRR